ncbi:MAG: hypothetical protein N4A57_03925 [Anaeromicrobium sp.]|jgi:hypothetical protein|nr:hypothetical protein [Anaeromicrobium sp.]MCT4593408.1 hypothetical protein [Anaeromicrobium sp.]
MGKEKKSILVKLFGGSGGCSCGVQIVEEEKKTDNNKGTSKKTKK